MRSRVLKIAGTAIVLLGIFALGVAAGSQTTPARADAAPAPAAQTVDEEKGVVIVAVDPQGPAAAAGVKRGDILLSIGDTEVNTHAELLRDIRGRAAGDQVTLKLMHGDEERALTATLADRNGRPYLGVVSVGGRHTFAFEALPVEPAATIVEVVPGGPAEEAGLQAGDRIVAVDGQELSAGKDLGAVIKSHAPGDAITLRIERQGEEARDVRVTLGEHPDEAGAAYLGIAYRPGIGVFRSEFPFEGKLPFPAPELPEGVTGGAFIGQVVADGPAAQAGLKTGDIITEADGKAIEKPQDLTDAVAAHKPGDSIVLKVYRTGEADPVEITATLGQHPDQAGKAYLGVSIGGFFFHRFDRGLPQGFQMPEFRFDFHPPLDEVPFPVNPPDVEPPANIGDTA